MINANDVRSPILWTLSSGLLATLTYLIFRLISHRRFYRDLPGPPHSWFWGHIKIFGLYTRRLPHGSYFQAALAQMKEDYSLPDIFYLDLWPIGPRFVFCSSPETAALPTTIRAFPQSQLIGKFLDGTLGSTAIEATNGALWKSLHRMLGPGLTPGAVKTYHSFMIEEATVFCDKLKVSAQNEEVIDISARIGELLFDVVSWIVFGESSHAQSTGSQLHHDLGEILEILGRTSASASIPLPAWLAGRRQKRLVNAIDSEVNQRIHQRSLALQEVGDNTMKSAPKCLVDRMLLEYKKNERPLNEVANKLILENTKGMIAAGFNTTADVLSKSKYVFILLSVHPEVRRKLCEEHDTIDKHPTTTIQHLQDNPSLLQGLEYTTAVLYETMRLFPISMVCRDPPSDVETIEHEGQSYVVKDHAVGICSYMMHYDASVFPEPKEFKPERFTGAQAYARSGYRPFERGLRSCMGQSLAMDQMRIVLLMTVRWFTFDLHDYEPSKTQLFSHTDMDTKIGKYAFQQMNLTAGPPGPVRMKIHGDVKGEC
ncbi:cytochrome P450 monooxygenase [Fusarium heterosporum]|uniref:Cytochrome P450 monooxygenase n=1 Tax=Fusarium heterosporum TaxID=42747 RepID=A0A8H5WYS8_FUSHE|nr:cytochrome P450 monooxygenase [Fusarium heterosporum]